MDGYFLRICSTQNAVILLSALLYSLVLSLESIGACRNFSTLVVVLCVLKSVVVRNVGLVGACTMEIEVLAVG